MNLWFMRLQRPKWFKLLKLFTSDPNQDSCIKIFAHSKALFFNGQIGIRLQGLDRQMH